VSCFRRGMSAQGAGQSAYGWLERWTRLADGDGVHPLVPRHEVATPHRTRARLRHEFLHAKRGQHRRRTERDSTHEAGQVERVRVIERVRGVDVVADVALYPAGSAPRQRSAVYTARSMRRREQGARTAVRPSLRRSCAPTGRPRDPRLPRSGLCKWASSHRRSYRARVAGSACRRSRRNMNKRRARARTPRARKGVLLLCAWW
jgi:hypothetical protein